MDPDALPSVDFNVDPPPPLLCQWVSLLRPPPPTALSVGFTVETPPPPPPLLCQWVSLVRPPPLPMLCCQWVSSQSPFCLFLVSLCFSAEVPGDCLGRKRSSDSVAASLCKSSSPIRTTALSLKTKNTTLNPEPISVNSFFTVFSVHHNTALRTNQRKLILYLVLLLVFSVRSSPGCLMSLVSVIGGLSSSVLLLQVFQKDGTSTVVLVLVILLLSDCTRHS